MSDDNVVGVDPHPTLAHLGVEIGHAEIGFTKLKSDMQKISKSNFDL